MNLEESYKVLELEKTNSWQEVKQAYRDIVYVWHPDRLENNDRIKKKAQKKLQDINLAYEILQNHLSDKLPAFTQIVIEPDLTTVKYQQTQIFTAYGIDLIGNKRAIETITWEAQGGVIYQDGLFFADDQEGEYEISATFGNLQAKAKVKLITLNADKKASKVSLLDKIKYRLAKKIKSYVSKVFDDIKKNPSVVKISKTLQTWYQAIVRFLILTRSLLWGLMTWGVMTDEKIVFSPETNGLLRILTILSACWLLNIISPRLVPNFGLVKNNQGDTSGLNTNITSQSDRAQISAFYSLLISILAGLILMEETPLQTIVDLNDLQNWLLGFSSLTIVFTLTYPSGSIMGSVLAKTKKQNRFTVTIGFLTIMSLLMGIIALVR